MHKRQDGLYREKLRINGKDKYFYGKTKAEVMRKVMEYKEEQKNGIKFAELAKLWWEDTQEKIAANTTKSYKPAMERAVERFGDRYLISILPTEISLHIRQFAKTHADKTVRTQLMVYRLIFAYAIEEGYAMMNPARDLKVPTALPKRKVTMPTSEDIAKIKSSIDCTFGFFMFMALYTGMRRGELLALTWEDIDINAATIHINKSVYHVKNTPFIKDPKTETSIGSVPILDALMPEIKKRKNKGLVFPNSYGTLMNETQFQRQWELYTQESGVKCTPHQCRHAYATMLFEAGIPPEEAQVLLRHAQMSTTMDIYTDIRENKQKSIYNKVKAIDIS